jgi:hypothetical protein
LSFPGADLANHPREQGIPCTLVDLNHRPASAGRAWIKGKNLLKNILRRRDVRRLPGHCLAADQVAQSR